MNAHEYMRKWVISEAVRRNKKEKPKLKVPLTRFYKLEYLNAIMTSKYRTRVDMPDNYALLYTKVSEELLSVCRELIKLLKEVFLRWLDFHIWAPANFELVYGMYREKGGNDIEMVFTSDKSARYLTPLRTEYLTWTKDTKYEEDRLYEAFAAAYPGTTEELMRREDLWKWEFVPMQKVHSPERLRKIEGVRDPYMEYLSGKLEGNPAVISHLVNVLHSRGRLAAWLTDVDDDYLTALSNLGNTLPQGDDYGTLINIYRRKDLS